jgi:hypothetical protein
LGWHPEESPFLLFARQLSDVLPAAEQNSKTHMPENIRTADHTWMILNQMPNFQRFFRGYLDILKSNLKQVSVMELSTNNFEMRFHHNKFNSLNTRPGK